MSDSARADLLEIDVISEEPETSVAVVAEAFDELGMHPTLAARLPDVAKFSELPPWEILLAVAVGPSFVGPFFSALAKNFGDDAYKAMKRFVALMWAAQRRVDEQTGKSPRGGRLLLGDAQSGVFIEFEEDLPLVAYQALHRLKLDSLQPGTLRYERETGRWRDPSQEWAQLPTEEVNMAFQAAVKSCVTHPHDKTRAAHAVIEATAWSLPLAEQFVRDSWRDLETLNRLRRGSQ